MLLNFAISLQGYGTFLMNSLKAFAVHNHCYNFLTYADNSAIGYFKKQGFTAQISLPPEDVVGYIKVSLMATACLTSPILTFPSGIPSYPPPSPKKIVGL